MTRLKLNFQAVSAFSAWYPIKPEMYGHAELTSVLHNILLVARRWLILFTYVLHVVTELLYTVCYVIYCTVQCVLQVTHSCLLVSIGLRSVSVCCRQASSQPLDIQLQNGQILEHSRGCWRKKTFMLEIAYSLTS